MGKKVIRRTSEEVFRLWVDALRSGKYGQAFGQLRDGKGFCCLGVVCELARKDGGPQWWNEHYMERYGHLPDEIRKFLGISDEQQKELATKNDSRATFAEIADYIERTYMQP